jgi:hypothetical protein
MYWCVDIEHQINASVTSLPMISMFGGFEVLGTITIDLYGNTDVLMTVTNSTMAMLGQNASLAIDLNKLTCDEVNRYSFNITVPSVEGLLAFDDFDASTITNVDENTTVSIAHSPTPAPSLTPTPSPSSEVCLNDNDVTCPPHTDVNCTLCPNMLRHGALYPCYRASSIQLTQGRCLPALNSAVRFLENEDVSVVFSTVTSSVGTSPERFTSWVDR